MPQPAETRVRLDKWLWAARFFKTRSLAAAAVNGGKVHLNGQRAKPGKEILVGSRLRIHKGSLEWDIEVRVLANQRRPASEAVDFYRETEESRLRRQELVAARRERSATTAKPDSRPNKRDRRLLYRIRQQSG